MTTNTQHLATLYEVTRTLNSSLDLDEVLNHVMDQVIAVSGAHRGFLMLRDEGGPLNFRVAHGLDKATISDPASEVSQGVIDSVLADGQPLLASNAQFDNRLSARASVHFKGLRSVLCVPLAVRDKIIGLVYVDNPIKEGIFDQATLELVSAFASQAAVAIENARLYEVAVERGRMERELSMARDIQTRLLPPPPIGFPGYDLAAYWKSAREVAGDFYDFIPLPGGHMGIVIADVSDKGAPAALFMIVARSLIRGSAVNTLEPALTLSRANSLILTDSWSGMFVTAFYVVISPDDGQVVAACAGHNPPLVYRAATRQVGRLPTGGIPLGMFEPAEPRKLARELQSDDVLLLYTDGVTELENPAQEQFGEKGLSDALIATAHLPASGIVDHIMAEATRFQGAAQPFDDLTLVAIKRTG